MKIQKKINVITAVAFVACAAVTVVAFLMIGGGTDDEDYVRNAHTAEADSVNILLLGMDREAGLCDLIMLVNIDRHKDRAIAVQIPRDTYARYTEGSYRKLNGAYNSLGGAGGVARWLEDAFGITIDHYACIGLDTVREAVDAIGGVEVDVPCDMTYRDPEQGLYIDIRAGRTHLDGELAEQFLRFRSSYTMGDVGRLDAQKIFLAAFFEKVTRELTAADALRLLSSLDGVETDMSAVTMAGLCLSALDMSADNVFLATLAGREAIAEESGASYYVISSVAARDVMRQYFGADGSFDMDGLFLNSRYKSFSDAYLEEQQTQVVSVSHVSQNGVDIGT